MRLHAPNGKSTNARYRLGFSMYLGVSHHHYRFLSNRS